MLTESRVVFPCPLQLLANRGSRQLAWALSKCLLKNQAGVVMSCQRNRYPAVSPPCRTCKTRSRNSRMHGPIAARQLLLYHHMSARRAVFYLFVLSHLILGWERGSTRQTQQFPRPRPYQPQPRMPSRHLPSWGLQHPEMAAEQMYYRASFRL